MYQWELNYKWLTLYKQVCNHIIMTTPNSPPSSTPSHSLPSPLTPLPHTCASAAEPCEDLVILNLLHHISDMDITGKLLQASVLKYGETPLSG